jgi:hypothetical protein
MNRAGALAEDARRADRMTYIRASEALRKIREPTVGSVGFADEVVMHRNVMATGTSTFFVDLRKGPGPRARLNLPAIRRHCC